MGRPVDETLAKKPNSSRKLFERFSKIMASTNYSMVVGFSLCQVWLSLCFFAPQLFPRAYDIFVYELSLGVSVVSLLPAIVFTRRSERCLERSRVLLLLSVLAAAGTLLIPVLQQFGNGSAALQVLAALLTGIPSGWLFVAWYQAFYRANEMAGYVLSVLASSLFMYLITAAVLFPRVTSWVIVAISCLLPFASVSFLLRNSHARTVVCQSGFPAFKSGERKDLTQLCVGIFVISFIDEFMRNYYLEGGDLIFYSGSVNLGLIVLKVVISFFLVMMAQQKEPAMTAIYRASFLLIVIAVLFMPYADTTFFYGATNFGAYLFKIMVMLMAFRLCQRYLIAPVFLFGLTRVVFSLDLLLGFGLFELYQVHFGNWESSLGLISVILGVLAVTVYLFVFDRSANAVALQQVGSDDIHGAQTATCTRLIRVGGLTKRESDVLALIAKGRTASRIHDELHVSMNTVNSHTSHIYQKLGVHSRQELLDLIEKTEPDVL